MRSVGKSSFALPFVLATMGTLVGCQGGSSSTATAAGTASTLPAPAASAGNGANATSTAGAGGNSAQTASGGKGPAVTTAGTTGTTIAAGGSSGAATASPAGGTIGNAGTTASPVSSVGGASAGGASASGASAGGAGGTSMSKGGAAGAGGSNAGAAGNSSTSSINSAGSSGTTNPQGGGTAGPRHGSLCDANHQNCRCLSLASFGAQASNAYGEGVIGTPSSTTAFSLWLAEKTNAKVTMVETQPTITAEYLAQFDVILLQDLRGWAIGPAELVAIADWVKGGGGIIALSGYFNDDDAEVTAVNRVLAFTGMSYTGGAAGGSVPGNTCPESSKLLCPQATAQCCYCWNNTIPITYLSPGHPLTKNIKAIGAFGGRGINPGDATVVMRYDTAVVGAAKAVGSGKLFLFADEWVTYTSQWSGGSTPMGAPDAFNPCYDASASPPHYLTADKVFQVKQFWYNAIYYAAPQTECPFVVNDPEVILL